MEFIEKMALQPSADHILLIKILIIVIYLIHIPYLSILIASSFFSIGFKIMYLRDDEASYNRFSKDLIRFVTDSKGAFVLLGILPVLTLTFLYGQLFQDTDFAMVNYMFSTVILLFLGYVLLLVYRRFSLASGNLFLQFPSGLASFGLMLLAFLTFVSAISLIFQPEKWIFVNRFLPVFSDMKMLPRYLLFTSIAQVLFGGAILTLFLGRLKKQNQENEEYATFVRKFSLRLILVFLIALPIFALWAIYSFPDPAKSRDALLAFVVALGFLLIATFICYSSLIQQTRKHAAKLFGSALAGLLLFALSDQFALSHANEFQERQLVKEYDKIMVELKEEREAKMAAAPKVNGKDVFASICASCHAFDHKIVGPPYNEVLPQFKNRKDDLVAFILNPYKVNPDYPPMPNLGLNRAQAEAVAEYLLGQIEQNK
jgi:cytochrome c